MAAMEQRMAKVFGLEGDAAWRRHANPWSVYTRIPGPAVLVAAIWTYTRLRWWSLIPVGIVCLWLAVNPRGCSRHRSRWTTGRREPCSARRSGQTAGPLLFRHGTGSHRTS